MTTPVATRPTEAPPLVAPPSPERGELAPTAQELREMVTRAEEIRAIIDDYRRNVLKEGVDYGGYKPGAKPSLLKPGAEKFTILLQLRAEFVPDVDTLAMAGNEQGLFAYQCLLFDRWQRVVGEGRGAASLNEKKWTVNNAIKMCQKRAHVDAILRVAGLSEIFTQDLEDMVEGEQQGETQQRQQNNRSTQQQGNGRQQNGGQRPQQSSGQPSRQVPDDAKRRHDLGETIKRKLDALKQAGLSDGDSDKLVAVITKGKPKNQLTIADLSALLNSLGLHAKTPDAARSVIASGSTEPTREQIGAAVLAELRRIYPETQAKRLALVHAYTGARELTELTDQELAASLKWIQQIVGPIDADDVIKRAGILDQIHKHMYKVLPGKADQHERVLQEFAGVEQPGTLDERGLTSLLTDLQSKLGTEEKALAFLNGQSPHNPLF